MSPEHYDYEKIRENYHSLLGLQQTFGNSAKNSMLNGNEIAEYEDLLRSASTELPNLLNPFDRNQYFSHSNGRNSDYYQSGGVMAHIARNLAKLKVRLDNSIATPATETKDFTFIANTDLRSILERDYQEIQRSLIANNWKSAIILSGGSIEAVLLGLLAKDESAAKSSSKAPAESSLNKWHLNDLIEVAVDTSQVGSEVGKLSHSVREYRNLIHPGLEIRGNLKVEPEEAKIALQVLKILIRDLSR